MREIPLGGKRAAGRVVRIDDADYDLVTQCRWHVFERYRPGGGLNGPYAKTNIKRGGRVTTLYMHQMITGWLRTDHQDGDGLNNQRHNLRPATNAQNSRNSRPRSGTSRFKGVWWVRQMHTWQAGIGIDGVTQHLGYFAIEEEAALAYNAAALQAWGEYAYLNQIDAPPAEEAA